jgi:chemotaxis protein histidine kinase CheA
MQDSNKLIKLVEQAACSINMLDPTDLSELDKLQKILEQIDESIVEISDGPDALLEEAKGTTADASEALQKMVTDQTKDDEASVETISQAVITLQGLTDQIEKAVDQPSPESPQATVATKTRKKSKSKTKTKAKTKTKTKTKTKAKAKSKTKSKSKPEVVVEAEPEAVTKTEPAAVVEEPVAEKDEASEPPPPPPPPPPAQKIDEDDIQLVQDFIAESIEHIEAAEAGLLELESKPDDSEVLNLIFRSFHTIKGMAGFLNLSELGSLAHSAENLLDNARKGELVLAGKNTDVIFESVDMLKNMIAGLTEAMDNDAPVASQKEFPLY